MQLLRSRDGEQLSARILWLDVEVHSHTTVQELLLRGCETLHGSGRHY